MSVGSIVDRWWGRASNLITVWPLVGTAAGGGLVTAILAAFTKWIEAWGPIGWAIAFWGGALACALMLWLFSAAYARFEVSQTAAALKRRSGTNPRSSRFDGEIINLIDFYSPFYISNGTKVFENCTVTGPMLVSFGDFTAIRCSIRHIQIVIAKDNSPVISTVQFDHTTMINCNLLNFTMVMNKATYDNLPDDFKQAVPVINA